MQANLDALGSARGCATALQRCAMVLRAVRRAIGEAGTVVVPTYTFSFCRHERFDVDRSETVGGPWNPSADFAEYVRLSAEARRSRDPIHSVAVLGPAAPRLIEDLPPTCFGVDSLQHRLRRAGARICMIGLPVAESTMVHHAEVLGRVPFRYKKLFTGEIIEQGVGHRVGWIYEVRVPVPQTELDGARIARRAAERGVVLRVRVGRDAVHIMEAQAFYEFLSGAIAADPWFTVEGPPAADLVAAQRQHLKVRPPRTPLLPADAPMEVIVRDLWRLRRDIVSDGYDAALAALAAQVPMRIHEYPTGTECSTWIVPEKWTCHEAWLATVDGRRLFSYADHPLHVVSYSLPFEGVVSRGELEPHLHVHPRLPEAVPFVFKYYERDWGLCCSRRQRDRLQDPHYQVVIRSNFSYGTLKVGEVIVPGASDETIVLCAHLCHPGMAVDDLSGVAVGIGVVRELLQRVAPPRYTIRLLILPETIGSLAWLSDHASLIPRMKGGLFLEMLGLDHPHALQRSFAGETDVDACFMAALASRDPYGWTSPYRTLPGNDERQFNAPGVRVPMLLLTRVLPVSAPDHPYREYHSSEDTPAIVPPARLKESRDLVLHMLDTLDANRVPINRFAGEICCSRYGLHVDWWSDPDAHRALFTIMDLIDGTRSIVQIAAAARVRVETVRQVLDALERHRLIDYGEPTPGGLPPHERGLR